MYVQQINRTPTRCKIAPSPDHYPSNVNAFASKSSLTKDNRNSCILDDFHHTNSLCNININNNNNNINHNNNNNVNISSNKHNNSQRNNNSNNLSRIFRIRQSMLPKQTNHTNTNRNCCNLTSGKCKATNNDFSNFKHNARSKQSNEMSMASISPVSSSISSALSPSPLIFEDEEIIFTENQIYIGINEHRQMNNHNNNNNHNCSSYNKIRNNDTNLNENFIGNNSNGYGGGDGCAGSSKKLQDKSTFNLVTGNVFNLKKNGAKQGCGPGSSDTMMNGNANDVFEKVKMDKARKSSSPFSSPTGHDGFFNSSSINNNNSIFMDSNSINNSVLSGGADFNCHNNSIKAKQDALNRQHFLFGSNLDLIYDDDLKCASAFDYEVDNSPTKRLSEYDNLNETFCLSHAMCKQNNANRNKYLADNNDSGYGNGTYAETWDFLNNRPSHSPSSQSSTTASTTNCKPLSKKLYEIHYETAVSGSSRRTSISTIETWIDDEVFDNSFNEELEKRCASLTPATYR